MEGLFGKLRNLDAYPKINEDFYSRTLSGGIITIASSIVMLLLFLSELGSYINPSTETKLVVDTSRGETLKINFDVTFPSLACSMLSLDAMDISGEEHLDVRHDIIKKRIDSHGNVIESRQEGIGAPKIEKPLQRHGGRLEHNETYCGSCYGAETSDEDCCNSCEEVREAYRKKGWGISNPDVIDQCKREGFLQRIKDEEGEGCNVYGFLEVKKVAGNFHFAPGKSFQQSNIHVHDLLGFDKDSFNISHKINKLAFGDYFPGVVNPLDGAHWMQQSQHGSYQYFIKVVPTVYTDINGRVIQTNQFSVTEHFRSENFLHQYLPGVFFYYDLSPIKVRKALNRRKFEKTVTLPEASMIPVTGIMILSIPSTTPNNRHRYWITLTVYSLKFSVPIRVRGIGSSGLLAVTVIAEASVTLLRVSSTSRKTL